MAFYDKFPYTNFQELNLDRLIQELMKVKEGLNFVIENASLKYADPIQWNITHQYQANTVVIDPATGIAYISTKPVPDNILITDTGYWSPIFDLSELFTKYKAVFTTNIEDGTTASVNYVINDLVWCADILYRITQPVSAGGAIASGTNAEPVSMEDLFKYLLDRIADTNTAISDEATARENADTELRTAIGENTAAIEANQTAIEANQTAIENINNELEYDVPENVKKHGVIGNGITDDTAALQSVINDYAWVYIPPGTYNVSNTINIPAGHRVSGTRESIIQLTTAGVTLFTMEARANLEHLNLQGNTPNTVGGTLIDIAGHSWVTINDIYARGGNKGIVCGVDTGDTCTGAYISNCTFHDYASAGIQFYKSNDCYLLTCIFNSGEDNEVANDLEMNYNGYCESHTFQSCSFLNGKRAILIGNDGTRYNHWNNCMFDSAQQSFINNGHDNVFTNCWFSNRGNSGMVIGNAMDTKFVGCTFKNCAPYGIEVVSTAAATTISNCYFAGNQLGGAKVAGAQKIMLDGNTFSNETFGFTQPVGIVGTPSSGIVNNNMMISQTGLPAASSSLSVTGNISI